MSEFSGPPKSIVDSGERPKVSVILGVRNEYPVILGTIFSFIEELEFWGYPYEIIVVDNMSTDNTSWILKDKFRRWVREKPPILKLIEFHDRPANVTVRNIGAREADGEVVFLSDGHISVKIGTCHGMIQGWISKGRKGLWHSAIHIWGDTTDIRCYGYDLKLRERFWGNLSRFIPKEAYKDGVPIPYRVPMASHCALMSGREEYLRYKGYAEMFKCYGGGEPYLDLLYWLMGSEVWIFPEGLMRHAFGVNAMWKMVTADKDKLKELGVQGRRPAVVRSRVQCRDGTQRADLKEGDQYLHYSRGYAWNNEQFQYNFMLAAYLIGGYEWLKQRYEVYYETRRGNSRYLDDIRGLRKEVLLNGRDLRKWIEENQVMSLDELLEKNPWENFSDL